MDDNKKDSIGEEVSAFGQRAKGDIKEATGTVTGNSSLRAEGAAESATGAARQKSNRMVTGLFRDRDSAERAYGSLSTRGYSKDDVNLLMSDETRDRHFKSDDAADTDLGSKALEGAGAGAGGATGGLIGALIGSGIPEDRARVYDEGVRNGGIVMGVNARSDEDAEYFENEFKTHRGENVYR